MKKCRTNMASMHANNLQATAGSNTAASYSLVVWKQSVKLHAQATQYKVVFRYIMELQGVHSWGVMQCVAVAASDTCRKGDDPL